MDRAEQLERYREAMGDEAAMRQVIDAQRRRNCCGTLHVEEHHPDCTSHPKKRAVKAYRKHFGDGVRSEEM